ncbi:MAG: hypothetical protein ACP5LW_05780 [Nitrososphaeria archaeon]
MRLSDIPDEKLQKIREWIELHKKDYPVTSQDPSKSMIYKLKELFGVELSPSQVYTLMRGYKTVKIKLPEETIKELERVFGDLSTGVNKVSKIISSNMMAPTPDLLDVINQFEDEKLYTYNEIVERLRKVKGDRAQEYAGIMFKRGYFTRERTGLFRFRRIPVPQELQLMLYLMGVRV